jgi:hypothetical protein
MKSELANYLNAERAKEKPIIVRAFSCCGPCLILGKLTKQTAQFYCYDEWQGGDRYEGAKRVRKETPEHYSGAHIEPCPSCRDHAKTQYPNGYMD